MAGSGVSQRSTAPSTAVRWSTLSMWTVSSFRGVADRPELAHRRTCDGCDRWQSSSLKRSPDPNITGSYHILKHERLSCLFMRPTGGLWARGFELSSCFMLKCRTHITEARSLFAFPSSSVFHLWISLTDGLFLLSQTVGETRGVFFVLFCFFGAICTQTQYIYILQCWCMNVIFLSHAPSQSCSVLYNSPDYHMQLHNCQSQLPNWITGIQLKSQPLR